MFYHRGFSHDVEALHFKIIVLCAIFCLSTFGPCTMTGTHNPTGYDLSSDSDNLLVSDTRKRIPPPKLNLENICRHSDLFCFPSTLSSDFHTAEANVSGFSDDTWSSSNHGNFQLLNGNIVTCSLDLKENDQHDTFDNSNTPFVRIKSKRVNDFSSPDVHISHHLLDWGQKYLRIPSSAYLTVENRHKSSVLNVFEPYSTNRQFYPCNYSEITIRPGENASVCFVFLPKNLGFSSGQFVLQTSSGGFLVQAQGFAVEPPYKIQSSVGSGSRVVSVFNPSDKVLKVKEVSAWISFSSGNVSYTVNGVCSVTDHTGSSNSNVNEQLDVKIGQVGHPVMVIRPHKTWTVGSNRNEPVLELEFPYRSQANVHGSFYVQLLKPGSRDEFDTLVLEAEFGGKSVETRLLISLDVLMPCDDNGTTVVSVLVENDSPDLLTVFEISQVGDDKAVLRTKYVEGLILFPHTVTQVAMVTYSPNSRTNLNCKLVIQTNKSSDHEVEISCSEIASMCSHSYGVLEIKATETTTADESVLGNWRSHGTEDGMSVLDDNELLFPMVHIDTHQSKWINIVNPSNQPVIMQLLLNSGEIINECRESDELLRPSSSYNLVRTSPSRYGFSIAKNAVTEAYVHPREKAVLGPIIFHPSSRCVWKSSVLVRNNLSGVEWLSLRGSGGSVSLTLLDESGPVHTIKLKNNYGQSFMNVLYAKNIGDLPVKVDKISVSGTKCELDGFVVGNCKGFDLQPGESRKIVVSYRADYCAETVRRELELGMTGGILVVPMEVSLPTPMLTVCKRSLFWAKFKKFVLSVVVSILLAFMACSCTFSFIIRGGTNASDVCSKAEILNVLPEPPKEVVTSSSSPSPSSSYVAVEESKPENLTVKTRKEKARRRKKKKNSGLGLGLTGLFEVSSSSHSSNSTPSSPLSPCQNVRARSPFSYGSTSAVLSLKEKPSTPPPPPPKTTTNAPFEGALGAERKVVKRDESSGSDDGFKYNIWDYHLQLRFPGSAEVAVSGMGMPTIAEEYNFCSLFKTSPQELFETCQPESVRFKQDD